MMPIRRYRKDPRAAAERESDKEVLELFERGDFLEVDPVAEREAIDQVQGRHQARRETVAALGKELGILRRAHGLTQEQVALALGTKKSNISRLESGQYGGLTIEYFMAVIDAFRALEGARSAGLKGREAPAVRKAPSNKALHLTKPSRALGSRR
jgi:DNA-binding XRE family transcriptional regulator